MQREVLLLKLGIIQDTQRPEVIERHRQDIHRMLDELCADRLEELTNE